jgi:hypothetical protein
MLDQRTIEMIAINYGQLRSISCQFIEARGT